MDRRLMNTSYLQGRINDLHALHNRTISDYGELVASLNEECDIFCEIIPSYKISNELKAGDDEVRMKKEVFNVERLEHEMLGQYEHFLQLLRKLSKKSHPEQQALGARLCAKLLPEAHEFNRNDVLLTLAVEFANAKATRVAQPALKALQDLLDGEMVSEATEHIVGAILAIVRRQHHALNPKLLNVLLYMRVAMVDMHRKDVTEEAAKNKRLKKKDKELARQMQKSKARRDRAELASKQTQIIHRVFVIYLRVLQASKSCSRQHQAKILAPALEGLCKFAPLVNLELHQQLMKALRELVDDSETMVTTKLHALVAVACLAQKDVSLDASEWRVDLSHFHEVLFQCLPEALSLPNTEKPAEEAVEEADETASQGSVGTIGTLSSQAFSIAQSMADHQLTQSSAGKEWVYCTGLVLRAVDLLIVMQRHLPALRVTAFVRRVLQNAPLCPPSISLALITLCHRLILRHPSCASVLIGGNDNILGGKGIFDPTAESIGSSHSDCSFAWELSLLSQSYHPTVREVWEATARHYLKLSKHQQGQAPVVSRRLDQLGPLEVLEQYSSANGDIYPPPPAPGSTTIKQRSKKRPREEEGVNDE